MKALVFAIAFALGTTALARADEFCDTPGKLGELNAQLDAKWKLFKAKDLKDTEAYFGQLVADHEAGRISDAKLARAFSWFQCTDPSCEPLMTEWARLYPKSPAAHLALAHRYAAVGFAARGEDFAGKTSQAQFAAMGEAFRNAFQELDIADKHSKKPTLSASMRIWLGMASGGVRPRPTELYRSAIKDFPDTLQVRIRYVRASAPRWGGSIRQLESIVDDAKSLPPADRRYIEYLVLQEIGTTYQCGSCGTVDDDKALKYYQKSVPLCPGLDQSLSLLVDLQSKRRDYEGLRAAATEYLARYPRNGWAFYMRGWSYEAASRWTEARNDYEKAVQFGYPKAYLNLAWFQEMARGGPKDYRKALELYQIAESNRVEGARDHADRVRKLMDRAERK